MGLINSYIVLALISYFLNFISLSFPLQYAVATLMLFQFLEPTRVFPIQETSSVGYSAKNVLFLSYLNCIYLLGLCLRVT